MEDRLTKLTRAICTHGGPLAVVCVLLVFVAIGVAARAADATWSVLSFPLTIGRLIVKKVSLFVALLVQLFGPPIASAQLPQDMLFVSVKTSSNYETLYQRALDENKALVVFVNAPYHAVPGALNATATAFPEAKSPSIVVGVPKGGQLLRYDLSATATCEQLCAVIARARAGVLKGAVPCPCPDCPAGGFCSPWGVCGSPWCRPFPQAGSPFGKSAGPSGSFSPAGFPTPTFGPAFGGFTGGWSRAAAGGSC